MGFENQIFILTFGQSRWSSMVEKNLLNRTKNEILREVPRFHMGQPVGEFG